MHHTGKLKELFLKIIKNEHTFYILLLLLVNLRILAWFQDKYILSSGDFRLPYNVNAFLQKILYAWTEIDYGLPSIYYVRIFNPFYAILTGLTCLGLDISTAELIAGYIVYTLAAISMYYIAYRILGNSLASFISSLFLISNTFLVSDREMLALGIMVSNLYVALPSLALMVKLLSSSNRSILYYFAYSVLVIPVISSLPNYRPLIIYLILTAIITLYFSLKDGKIAINYLASSTKNPYGKLVITFVNTRLRNTIILTFKLLLSSLPILVVLIIPLLLLSSWFLQTYSSITLPSFIIEKFYVHDTLRLIAKWGFYTKSMLGTLLVPYSTMYLKNNFIILVTYVPFIIVVLTLLFARTMRKTILYFGFWYTLVLLVLVISKTGIYNILLSIPLLKVFRAPSNWLYIVVFIQSIIMGLFILDVLSRIRMRSIFTIVFGLLIFSIVVSSYPLYTGDVSLNWVKPEIKGTLIPAEYKVINTYLDEKYWSLLAPPRGSYVVYDFKGIPFHAGNPYPFIFTKPVITGVGLDYVKASEDISHVIQMLFNKIGELPRGIEFYQFMSIGSIIWENQSNIMLGARRIQFNDDVLGIVVRNRYYVVYSIPNPCEKLRVATSVRYYSRIDELTRRLREEGVRDKCSIVFVNNKSLYNMLNSKLEKSRGPEILRWEQVSPSKYLVRIRVHGYAVLVLMEAYSSQWKAQVLRGEGSVEAHFKSNGGFNSWLIRGNGDLEVVVFYEGQNYLNISLTSALVLIVLGVGVILFKAYGKVKELTARYLV